MLTCSTSSPARLSSILRLPIQKTHQGLVEALRGKPAQWQAEAPKYDAVDVSTGPVLENVQKADVDLLAFPSPFWHEMDGGRYIGTGCSVVTRDFDSDWVNVGTYRVQVLDRNHVALDMVPGKHGRIQYEKHKKAGKRFPVAIVLGADPLGYLISGIEIPFGMCEWNYIGAILEQPVAVVRGEAHRACHSRPPRRSCSKASSSRTTSAPKDRSANSMATTRARPERRPCVTVERVYFRNDPIIVGSPPAKPPNDYSYSKAVMRSALLYDALVAAGVPDVQGGMGARDRRRAHVQRGVDQAALRRPRAPGRPHPQPVRRRRLHVALLGRGRRRHRSRRTCRK